MFKLRFTSIPVFIKEYILQKKMDDSYKDLKFFSTESLSVLSELTFYELKEGYRTLFKANLDKIDYTKRFVVDIFFNFLKAKTQMVKQSITYDIELGIGDSINNETFEVIYEDDFGDSEKIKLILKEYDSYSFEISFMKV